MSIRSLMAHFTRIANPKTYNREQWWALALSLVCIATGVWAAISTYHGFGREDTPAHPPATAFVPAVWGTEAALALVTVCVLAFAFSNRAPTARTR